MAIEVPPSALDAVRAALNDRTKILVVAPTDSNVRWSMPGKLW